MPDPAATPWSVRRCPAGDGLAVATQRLLGLLPDWFGIPAANAHYVGSARQLPGYLAVDAGGVVIGLLTVKRHFTRAAEVYLMAVAPDWHRHGVGTGLLAAAEHDLAVDGRRLLQVKTLGPSHPSPQYAATRQFYLARGFEPIEEIRDLWPGNPCLLMIKPLPAPAGRS